MTATILPDGHKHGHWHPTRLHDTALKFVTSATAVITYTTPVTGLLPAPT